MQQGDTVRFGCEKYDEDLYEEGDVQVSKRTNPESNSDRQSADDALQIGEEFMINSSRFRVVDRDVASMKWRRIHPGELECIEDRDARARSVSSLRIIPVTSAVTMPPPLFSKNTAFPSRGTRC